MERKDDQWFAGEGENENEDDWWVYGSDGDAVCRPFANLGMLADRIITSQERAERIAKLPVLEQRAEQAEALLRESLATMLRMAAGATYGEGEMCCDGTSGGTGYRHEADCIVLRVEKHLDPT